MVPKTLAPWMDLLRHRGHTMSAHNSEQRWIYAVHIIVRLGRTGRASGVVAEARCFLLRTAPGYHSLPVCQAELPSRIGWPICRVGAGLVYACGGPASLGVPPLEDHLLPPGPCRCPSRGALSSPATAIAFALLFSGRLSLLAASSTRGAYTVCAGV